MKKNIGIYIIGLILLVVSACYDDKGNYSYSDINQMTLKITPASEGQDESIYIFTQSPKDSLFIDLSSEISQSLNRDESNLAYKWVRRWSLDRKNYGDTVHTKTCTFKFPPKTAMTYSVLFIIKDESNGLEIYKDLTVKTVVPYIRSWLILHGDDGDRRLGALEYDATRIKVQRKEVDIYESLKGSRRFQKAFDIEYASGYSNDIELGDKLFVFQPDSSTWVYPFNCNQKGFTERMMPGGWNSSFVSSASNTNARFGVISAEGKYYHNGAFGYFYEAEAATGAENYHADRVYISSDSYTTLWDNVNKKLMYYGSGNWYDWMTDARQNTNAFTNRIVNITKQELKDFDLSDCQLLWLGEGLTNKSSTGASALFEKTATKEYYIINVGYGGKDKSFSLLATNGKDEPAGFVGADTVKLNNVNFDENTLFTSTSAFKNQLFYSVGGDLYLYSVISGESDFLYSVGEGKRITLLSFRQNYDKGGVDQGNEKILGIAVQAANGQGEFHEIVLDEGGDVTNSASYDGFGPIVDICYTYLSHTLYDM